MNGFIILDAESGLNIYSQSWTDNFGFKTYGTSFSYLNLLLDVFEIVNAHVLSARIYAFISLSELIIKNNEQVYHLLF